jgi:hypothetical protein
MAFFLILFWRSYCDDFSASAAFSTTLAALGRLEKLEIRSWNWEMERLNKR